MLIFLLLIFFSTMQVHANISNDFAQKNVIYSDNATKVLDSMYYQPVSPSIITEHEWKEFQLDRLIKIVDRKTTTAFGSWGLEQLLHPIANSDDLAQRKEIITFLIENEKELTLFQEQLKRIHVVEKSLLAYWDKNDAVDKNSQQFYYSFPGIKEGLNDSSLALNGSVLMQMFNAGTGFLASICLGGLQAEASKWMISPEKNFDWWEAIKTGFREPFTMNNPMLDLFKDYDKSYQYTSKDYMRAIFYGSWGDRYKIFSAGYTVDIKSPAWVPVWLIALITKLISVTPKTPGILSKFNAALAATLPALIYDYYKIMSIMSIGNYLVSMNQTLNQLHDRVMDVATCFNAIKSIDRTIKQYPIMTENSYIVIEYTDQINKFLEKLMSSRFIQKRSYVYSRGHVLSMHKEIKDIKRLIIPLLQSIAFLDAFCSIAQLYKESQDKPVKFSFPEFVPSQKPFFSYTDAWLPLLPYNEAVTNDLCLGRDNSCPGKIIITGPNGGGKSTLLKTYGVAAILAQSWLIIPATHGSQTLFSEIKTGLAPHEDLEKGLSTFMAEKKRMGELFESMQKNDAKRFKTLVLIDEPYKGTVDAESAKRIYQFGKDIAGFSYVLVAIATHVKKPIALEVDTHGIFGNYQVKIDELSPGIFKRLFKIEKGPAMWWFEDADKRSRFIDWIEIKPVVSR